MYAYEELLLSSVLYINIQFHVLIVEPGEKADKNGVVTGAVFIMGNKITKTYINAESFINIKPVKSAAVAAGR